MSPEVGFFMPTGIPTPLAIMRWTWSSTERARRRHRTGGPISSGKFPDRGFFGTGKACFLDDAGIEFTDGDDAAQHVFLSFRIGLMEHPFIADADGPRLAGVHPGNDEDLVFYLLLYLDQAVDVIEDGPFIVGRTRADDEQKASSFPDKIFLMASSVFV